MNNARIRRLIDELHREIATEERFPVEQRPIQFATQIVPLEPISHPVHDDPRNQVRALAARPRRICRPYRLVVQTADPAWLIIGADSGGCPLLPSGHPVPAVAFTPLPPWMLDAPDLANKPEPEHLQALRREWPLSNIEPITLQPGMECRILIQWDRTDIPRTPELPPAWLLAHVPEVF